MNDSVDWFWMVWFIAMVASMLYGIPRLCRRVVWDALRAKANTEGVEK